MKIGRGSVLLTPARVNTWYSRLAQLPGRLVVLASAVKKACPTGTPDSWNCPCPSVTAIWAELRKRMVTPGTGAPWLSSTTPLIEVADGSDSTKPEALKMAGSTDIPAKLAAT